MELLLKKEANEKQPRVKTRETTYCVAVLLGVCALRPPATGDRPALTDSNLAKFGLNARGNHFVWKADGHLHLVCQGLRRGPPKAWCRECLVSGRSSGSTFLYELKRLKPKLIFPNLSTTPSACQHLVRVA